MFNPLLPVSDGSQRYPLCSDGKKDTLRHRVMEFGLYPAGGIGAHPLYTLKHLREGDQSVAGIERIGCRQYRLVVGNSVAQQLDRFEAVMDLATLASRIRKRGMEFPVGPEAQVILILQEVNPKPECEFGNDFSGPGGSTRHTRYRRLGFGVGKLIVPVWRQGNGRNGEERSVIPRGGPLAGGEGI
jgi:hypothetical protein